MSEYNEYMMDKRKIAVKWILFSFALIVNIFIIVQSCLNGEKSGEQSLSFTQIIQDIVNSVSPNTINETNIDSFHGFVRKFIGHFSLFLLDGFISSWALIYFFTNSKFDKWWIKLIISGIFGLLIALISEIIQLNVPGRAGSFIDVLIDYAGYSLAAFVVYFIYANHLYILKNKENK